MPNTLCAILWEFILSVYLLIIQSQKPNYISIQFKIHYFPHNFYAHWEHIHQGLHSLSELLQSRKARQLILTPKLPSVCIYVCIYVYMPVTVSYRHLTRGLEIVSVAIPIAISCSIYLYNILNSRFRLLPILRCTCGSQFSDWLRQVSVPFSAPGPRQNPFGPRGCRAKWCQLPKKGA